MTVALIATSPRSIICTFASTPGKIALPDGRQVQAAAVGWTSADGAYSLVAVQSFVPPQGQVPVGAPSYSFDGGGNVVETFATQQTPLNIIQFATFIGRWTAAEYALLMQKRAAAVSAGAAQISLVQQWDQALASGSVDLNSNAAQNFKAAIVSAAILTQARADVIFS